jgi:CRP-like cAMP-binding protein
LPENDKPKLFFLAEGQMARLMDSGNGWLNMLDVAMDGAWINETVLLPKCKSKSAAEVISEEARILAIPADDFEAVLGAEPPLMRRAFLHVLKEMEKYERRWVET